MAYCDCGSPATVVEAAGTTIARTASYEYDFQGKRWKTTTPEGSMSTNSIPYGGLISSNGTLAGANTRRFSSKPAIFSATGSWGFYYYGYRFYDPGMQRWLNRDPLGEEGGTNLQTFISNESALTPSGKPIHRGADNATPPGYTYNE
jgi:RHS repeat-associated protein